MDFEPIVKSSNDWKVAPNLPDYAATRAAFSWEMIDSELDGLPDGMGLNIAYEAVDRHASGPKRDKVAIRWLGKRGDVRDITYGELCEQSNRFANVLQKLGIGKSDRVFVLAGRIPQLYFSVLGTLKNTSVLAPLFSAFGPEPIAQRLTIGEGKVLVTTKSLFKRKVAKQFHDLPDLQFVLLADVDEDVNEDVLSLPKLMAEASPEFTIPPH